MKNAEKIKEEMIFRKWIEWNRKKVSSKDFCLYFGEKNKEELTRLWRKFNIEKEVYNLLRKHNLEVDGKIMMKSNKNDKSPLDDIVVNEAIEKYIRQKTAEEIFKDLGEAKLVMVNNEWGINLTDFKAIKKKWKVK